MIEDIHRNPRGEPSRHRWLDGGRVSGVAVWADYARDIQVWSDGVIVADYCFDPTDTDCGPLEAYCRGDMPAHVFSDWVEENAPDFPAEGLAILRADLG